MKNAENGATLFTPSSKIRPFVKYDFWWSMPFGGVGSLAKYAL